MRIYINAFGEKNYEAAMNHWLNHGINEGRQGCAEFDLKFYLNHHGDLLDHFGPKNYKGALQHYYIHGLKEGRQGSSDFWIAKIVKKFPGVEEVTNHEKNKAGYFFAWYLYYLNALDIEDPIRVFGWNDEDKTTNVNGTIGYFLAITNAIRTSSVFGSEVAQTITDAVRMIGDAFKCFGSLGRDVVSCYQAAQGAYNWFEKVDKIIEETNRAIENRRIRKYRELRDEYTDPNDKSKWGDYPSPSFRFA